LPKTPTRAVVIVIETEEARMGTDHRDQTGPRAGGAGMPVVRAHVAGIDVGSEQHWVCAPSLTGDEREVAVFGATTGELERLAAWLQARGVTSVALESTGVYWIAPHEVLEAAGFEVCLVDTRALARVPGRSKSGLSGL
jgi:transposase